MLWLAVVLLLISLLGMVLCIIELKRHKEKFSYIIGIIFTALLSLVLASYIILTFIFVSAID